MARPPCIKVREMLSAYIDGELSPQARFSVRAHLETCPSCFEKMEALRVISASVRGWPGPELPADFHSALTHKIAAEASAARAGAARVGPLRRGPSWSAGGLGDLWGSLGSRLRRFPLRGAAVVAGLLIFVLWAGSFAFFMGLPVPGAELLGLKRSSEPGALSDTTSQIGFDTNRLGGSASPGGDGVTSEGAPGKDTSFIGAGGVSGLGSLSTTGRQVILSVNLTVECEQVGQARDKAVSAAEAAGGFVESLNYWTDSEGLVSASMALRVPAASLSNVLDQLRQLGTVLGEQASRADVTAQHIDLTARINNLRLQEQSLLSLLGKATSLGDIFAIQSELARIRTDIESYESQLRYLDEQVDLSSIYLSLQPAGAGPGPTSGFWERIVDAFLRSLRWMAGFAEQLAIFLAAVLAPLAVIGGLGWLVWRAVQSRRRRLGA